MIESIMATVLALFIALLTTTCTNALNNGIGLVPIMGLNTWNSLRCTKALNAKALQAYADAIVDHGLRDLGYQTLVIDDCWSMSTRNPSTGKLQPDPVQFPKGIAEVQQYVRRQNLTLGMYSDRGSKTCAGRPGSNGHETIDAEYFAIDVGISLLKYDSCYATSDHQTAFAEYGAMRDALNATGVRVNFQVCGWNAWYAPHGDSLGNSWRIAADADDWLHIYRAIRTNENLHQYAGPGHFNDPDMLVGSGKSTAVSITPIQSRTQFNMWAVMAAPLMIGADLADLSNWDLETYSNARVIAVDQDSRGQQGIPVFNDCPYQPYRPLEQSSPTTFPTNITPWTWSVVLQRQAATGTWCIGIFLLVASASVVLFGRSSESSKRYREFDLSFTQTMQADRTTNTNGVYRYVCWLSNLSCQRRVVVVVMALLGVIFVAIAVWFSVVLSWGVPSCAQVWAKPLTKVRGENKHRAALVMVNFGENRRTLRCDRSCLEKVGDGFARDDVVYVQDVWTNETTTIAASQQVEVICDLLKVAGGGASCMFVLETA